MSGGGLLEVGGVGVAVLAATSSYNLAAIFRPVLTASCHKPCGAIRSSGEQARHTHTHKHTMQP